MRNGRGRYPGGPASNGAGVCDRKPLVLSTYLDAQEHLPYADDSNAVTPMSEENGAIIMPVYYPGNLGTFVFRVSKDKTLIRAVYYLLVFYLLYNGFVATTFD